MNIKEIIQSSHVNFLIGSGVSSPFFSTLKDIEKVLTECDGIKDERSKAIIKASILKYYFDKCVKDNCKLLNDKNFFDTNDVAINYKNFFRGMNDLILRRKNNLLNKQINVFTTNMDIFQELAMESLGVEYNDGFIGRLNPIFNLSNFRKSISKTSQQYDVISEVPLVNLYKLHGSATWRASENNQIMFDEKLSKIIDVSRVDFGSSGILNITKEAGILKDLSELEKEIKKDKVDEQYSLSNKFMESYRKLLFINPTKEKFEFTTLNYTYYELLRIFSNNLEREGSVLFVMGFSFADEHIREIMLRSIKSNPTLIVCIFGYDKDGEEDIKANLKITLKVPELPPNVILIKRPLDKEGKELNFNLFNINNYLFSF